MKIEVINHSRLYSPNNPSVKSSEVSTTISEGALNQAAKMPNVELTITGPKNYHQVDEFIDMVENSVAHNGNDAIILPFSPQGKDGDKLIKILKEFNGKVIAVNVPPSQKTIKALDGKIKGYVGPCEKEMGRRAVRELMIRSKASIQFDELVIVTVGHEKNHYGHNLRIEGIKDIAKKYCDITDVYVLEIDAEDQEVILPSQLIGQDLGVITLGVRGTEAVLQSPWQKEIQNRLVGIDLNRTTCEAIEDFAVQCTLIQHPREQGRLAVNMAAIGARDHFYTEIYCGPTVVDNYNCNVFSQ